MTKRRKNRSKKTSRKSKTIEFDFDAWLKQRGPNESLNQSPPLEDNTNNEPDKKNTSSWWQLLKNIFIKKE